MVGERDLYRDKIEVSLDGRQVFYLFFGGAVIASLVFVLGVMIGKRIESRSHAELSATAELAQKDPLAALDMLATAGDADDLSFANTLRKPEPDVAPMAGEPLSQDSAKADKLAAEKAAAKAKAKAASEKAAKEAAAVKIADAKAAEAKAAKEKALADKKAADKAAADKKAKKAAAEKAALAAKNRQEAAVSKFTLQLSSFQSEDEAEVFYDQLRSSGYRPYISRADVPGKGTWYRVRLGKYPSFESAVEAKTSFEKKQKIIAYVTRISHK